MLVAFSTIQRLPRDLKLFFCAWGLVYFGYFGIFGVLFNLYLLRLGYGPETIGLLVGAGQLVWGLAAIPVGMVSGRIGNRNGLIAGLGIFGSTLFLLLLVAFLPAALRTGWIATWWISSWVGVAFLSVNGGPYIMAISPLADRHHAFTVAQVVPGFFGFIGSLAAGLFPNLLITFTGAEAAGSSAYWGVLWLAPLAYLAAALIMARTQPLTPLNATDTRSHSAKMPLFVILFVALIALLQTSSQGSLLAFFNIYMDVKLQVPLDRIGVVMGLGQFLPILSVLAAPMIMARLGTGGTISTMAILSALFMLLVVILPHWLAASGGYIGYLLAYSILTVAIGLFSQESVEPHWRTTMATAFTLGIALGSGTAASLGGYLITSFGYRAPFVLGAVTATAAGLLMWGYLYLGTRSKLAASATLHSASQ